MLSITKQNVFNKTFACCWYCFEGSYSSFNCIQSIKQQRQKQPPDVFFKGTLSGLRQFSATESPLKVLKNAFYFTSKAVFVFKIFKFLFWLFGHVAKRFDQKGKVSFKFYDVIAWLTNNCNTHIAQYLEKFRQSDNEIWSVNRT